MTVVIVFAALGFVLCAIAGLAKSHMDTIAFHGARGFGSYPGNLKYWLITSIPEAKWRDGWHVMQMIWHLSFALGFWCMAYAGFVFAGGSPWLFTAYFAGAWVLRLIAHGIGFSLTYPIK